MTSRKYVLVNGERYYDYTLGEETLCEHCGTGIEGEDICLVSIRISSISLTTEMGMEKPLAVHANCIYRCLQDHVMERVKERAGRWYVDPRPPQKSSRA